MREPLKHYRVDPGHRGPPVDKGVLTVSPEVVAILERLRAGHATMFAEPLSRTRMGSEALRREAARRRVLVRALYAFGLVIKTEERPYLSIWGRVLLDEIANPTRIKAKRIYVS